MRRTRFAPLALLILAAACTEDTTTFPSPDNQSADPDAAAYRQMIEEARQSRTSSAISLSMHEAACPEPAPPEGEGSEVVRNGGFELGEFGLCWTATVTGSPFLPLPWMIWDVREDGQGAGAVFIDDMDATSPQEGSYDASHGWDGIGAPFDFVLSQEVTLPPGTATLSWQDRIQWHFFGVPSEPRTHHVEIQDPETGEVLREVFQCSTDPASENLCTGEWEEHSRDVSEFAGQTVRLVFRQSMPESMIGPGQVEVDDVSLVVVESSEIVVEMDIKPGSDENPVNLRSRGVLPVAILTTDAFDAADVDVHSVTLGDGEGEDTHVAARGKNPRRAARPHASLEDVDDDGDLDLSLKFRTEDLVENGDLNDVTTELFLNGATQDGTAIVGSDGVQVRGQTDHEEEEVTAEEGDEGGDDADDENDDDEEDEEDDDEERGKRGNRGRSGGR